MGTERHAQRELGTVLFVDVVDSTRRLVDMGDEKWAAVLDALEGACQEAVTAANGRVVKTTGDGILATLPTPTAAVDCAVTIHHAAADLGLALRAGVHCGELQGRGDDVAGVAVHVAARLMGHAAAGETLVSNIVVLMAALSPDAFEPRGKVALKGLDAPVEVFALPTTVVVDEPAGGAAPAVPTLASLIDSGQLAQVAAMLPDLPEVTDLADLLAASRSRSEFLDVDLTLTRLIEDVLERLPADDDVRRARLEARLAFELRGDPSTLDERRRLLTSATERAERAADADAVVASLLARVHALWGPGGARELLSAAEEAVAVARRARLLERELEARIARVDVLVELGRITDAELELTTYARLAPADRHDLQAFLASRRGTIAAVHGRFRDVMREADAAEAHATAAGMADAGRLGMAMRAVVAREKGMREALSGAIDELLETSRRFPGHHFEANVARCLLEAGREEEARAELARAIPSISEGTGYRWLTATCDASVVAAAIGTEEDCRLLLDALDAHGADFAVLGPVFWGSIHAYAGALAARVGDAEDALRRYDRAVADLDRMGAPSWAAHARAGRATVLRQLGHDERAATDEHRAVETARALGMTALLEELTGEARRP